MAFRDGSMLAQLGAPDMRVPIAFAAVAARAIPGIPDRYASLIEQAVEGETVGVIVDTEERINAFLPELEELEIEGLVILEPVEVIRYAGRGASGQGNGRP